MYLKRCAKMNRAEGYSEALKPEVSVSHTPEVEVRTSTDQPHVLTGSVSICTLQILASIVVTEKKGRLYTYLDLVRTPNMRSMAARTGTVWSVLASVGGFG